MTINEYYITFGFKILLKSYMTLMGFTIEKLHEMRQKEGEFYNDIEDNDAVNQWFQEDHFTGFVGSHKFSIEGVEFIARGFSHDIDSDYVVVGVDLGTIDNYKGTIECTGHDARKSLEVLVDNSNWVKLIYESVNTTTTSISKEIKNGVRDEFGNYIEPQTYITTDDCKCCS